VLEHDARDYHDHNASNHSPNGSPANGSRFADDDNDAYGRRLLIAKARGAIASGAGTALWATHFKNAALNSTGHKPVATVVNDAQDS
jgi:hypothetical protein